MAITDKDQVGTGTRILMASSAGVHSSTQPYTEGTYTASLTGCTTVPTVTVSYVIVGKLVTVMLTPLTGTSNTTACTVTGAPAALFPATTTNVVVQSVVDNSLDHIGFVNINTLGVWTLFFYSAATTQTSTFTNAGTKGIGRCTFTYSLV